MNYAAFYSSFHTPQGELFLPTVEKCAHCEGSGTYKILGIYDIVCVFCAGTGEER